MSASSEEPHLAALDGLADEPSLRAQAEAMMTAWERGGAQPSNRYGAADPSKCIQVVVDPGGNVVDVSIDPNWPEFVTASKFPNGLLQAYRGAMRIAASARILASRDTAGSNSAPVADEPSSIDVVRAALNEALEAAARRLKDQAEEPKDRIIASPRRYFDLHFQAGDLAEITLGQRSLVRASLRDIHADCLAVLTQAQ